MCAMCSGYFNPTILPLLPTRLPFLTSCLAL